MSQTAAALDCSGMAVYNMLRANGWNREIEHTKAQTLEAMYEDTERFLDLYLAKSAEQIAKDNSFNLRGVIAFYKAQGVWLGAAKDRTQKALRNRTFGAIKRGERSIAQLLREDWSEAHPADYTWAVRLVSNQIYKKWKWLIDPHGFRSAASPLDHIFSIKSGMYRCVDGEWVRRSKPAPITMIAHPSNLRVIDVAWNSQRHNQRDPEIYSVKALKKRIRHFNPTLGDPFKDYR